MKLIYLVLLMALPAAHALEIGLSIEETYNVEVFYFAHNNTYDTNVFSTELTNPSSLPYLAQIRIDVFNETEKVFTGWSAGKTMPPGGIGFFELFWVPEVAGDYTARMRVYYTGEVIEIEKNISVERVTEKENVFHTDQKVFDKFIEFTLTSTEDAEVVVIADDYPQGWTFIQTKVTLEKNVPEKFLLPYTTPSFSQQDVSFSIVSLDGKYFGKETTNLQRETGFAAVIQNIIFKLLAK